MANNFKAFSDSNELSQFADKFVGDRIEALKYNLESLKDDDWELQTPFPFLLSCFSIIDLFGALYAGNASKAKTTNSENYMKDFLNYTEDEATILSKLFRHKLVHLSVPKVVLEHNSRLITWSIYPCNEIKHRKIKPTSEMKSVEITSKMSLQYNCVFNLSIKHFVDDISESAIEKNGYIEKLKNDVILQNNFDCAINQIYAII